jgi:hypothetical protein
MESHHRTHFLFLHPKNPPSKEPIEDDISKKVDFIYSKLKPGCHYRGMHSALSPKQLGKKRPSRES